jgi:hypothetical protein
LLVSRLALVLAAAVLFVAAGAHAHHGTSQYDMERQVILRGTVIEWRFANPHAWLTMEVATASGIRETWSIEGAPLRWLERNGWSATTLVAGEEVAATISPQRVVSRSGILREVTHADGTTRAIPRPNWERSTAPRGE